MPRNKIQNTKDSSNLNNDFRRSEINFGVLTIKIEIFLIPDVTKPKKITPEKNEYI